MKTSELTGEMLDYWVARAMDGEYKLYRFADDGKPPNDMAWVFPDGWHIRAATAFNPSTNWAQGGLIIERGTQGVFRTKFDNSPERAWTAISHAEFRHYGPTALVAAMRCYVASKFGAEVPDE